MRKPQSQGNSAATLICRGASNYHSVEVEDREGVVDEAATRSRHNSLPLMRSCQSVADITEPIVPIDPVKPDRPNNTAIVTNSGNKALAIGKLFEHGFDKVARVGNIVDRVKPR